MKKLIFLINLIMVMISYSEELTDGKIEDSKVTEEKKEYSSYILGDREGNVYYGENQDILYPLASVTKLMTAIVTYDAINNDEISKKDLVTIDKEIMKIGGSKVWMKLGQKISVEDLLKATSIHSANNAAYALAKYVGKGNVDNFIERMKKKIKDWNLENYVDINTPTGLPPSMTGKKRDIGSAIGIYSIGLKALEYPHLVETASTKETYIYNSQKIKNRNKLLGTEGIYGLKTGHYDEAGYNMAVVAKSENRDIVYVILGGKNEKVRDDKIVKDILKFYDEYNFKLLLDKNKPVWSYEVKDRNIRNVEVYPEKSYSKIIKKDSEIKFKIKRLKKRNNIKSGEKVGEYSLILNGEVAEKGNLVVREDISKLKRKFEEF